jgi:hypothetical protein
MNENQLQSPQHNTGRTMLTVAFPLVRVGAILALVTVFMKSAVILLPWTASSTILAGLAALQLGKWLGLTPGARAAVGAQGTLALTFAVGYLAYWLIPPVAPPEKTSWAALWVVPEPTAHDLWQMFPIHLAIWAVAAATVVGGWCYQLAEAQRVALLRATARTLGAVGPEP